MGRLIFFAISSAVLTYLAVRPVVAQVLEQELPFFSVPTRLNIIEKSIDGYSQIVLQEQAGQKVLSNPSRNSYHAQSRGSYVVFVSEIDFSPQIMLYDHQTQTTTQLTFSGSHLHPMVNTVGQVVFESWTENHWQISVFDQLKLFALETPFHSTSASINDDGYIVFSSKTSEGWRGYGYLIGQDGLVEVSSDPRSKFIRLEGEEISIGLEDREALLEKAIPEYFNRERKTPRRSLDQTFTLEDILEEISGEPLTQEASDQAEPEQRIDTSSEAYPEPTPIASPTTQLLPTLVPASASATVTPETSTESGRITP